jgi:hypothetical protein
MGFIFSPKNALDEENIFAKNTKNGPKADIGGIVYDFRLGDNRNLRV